MKPNDRRWQPKGGFRGGARKGLAKFVWLLFCILFKCISGQERPESMLRSLSAEEGATFPYLPAATPYPQLDEPISSPTEVDTNSKKTSAFHNFPLWLLTQANPKMSPVGQTSSNSVQTQRWIQISSEIRKRRNRREIYGRKGSRLPFLRLQVGGRRKRKRNLPNGEKKDPSTGRIHIADDVSYMSASFDRNSHGSSSFRHYKDFQNDLKPLEVGNRTMSLSLNSHQANRDKTSPNPQYSDSGAGSDFKFPDTIVKDGQIFYRHDVDEKPLEKAPTSPVTSSASDRSHHLQEVEDFIDSGELQMPRGFNLLMDHVRQAGAHRPIISAAIAGASIRGSSKGSTSHVIGSAINGGYFAASAQGYDGKGGEIHSHVRGTAESVSGGASAIAPNRDGEAFIQVDHSERGLSIGQSSTHNGEAFVIADVDSESKRTLQHGDSTSTYTNDYKTKTFGHSFGEAKSRIFPLKPKEKADENEQNIESLDTKVSKHSQRSVGIDMIDSIMEKVHLPSTHALPALKTKLDSFTEDTSWSQENSPKQEGYHDSTNFSGESQEEGEILREINGEYFEEGIFSSNSQKKGIAGVVTFPYDQEGLPPGPGELLKQDPQIHSHLTLNLVKGPQFHSPSSHGSHNITNDKIVSKSTYDKNRLPLFSSNIQRKNGYKIYPTSTKHYDDNIRINTDNLDEYRYPPVKERLSLNDLSERSNNKTEDDQSSFIDSTEFGVDEVPFNSVDTPVYSPSIKEDLPQIYYDRKVHNLNLTDVFDTSQRVDDFYYDHDLLSNSKHPKDNDTLKTNKFYQQQTYTNTNIQNFLSNSQRENKLPFEPRNISMPTVDNQFVKTNLVNQMREAEIASNSHDWKHSSPLNQQFYLSSDIKQNQFHEGADVHSTPRQTTELASRGTSDVKTGERKLHSDQKPKEAAKFDFHSFPSVVSQSHEINLAGSFPPDQSHLPDHAKINGYDRIHNISPGHSSNNDRTPWNDYTDDNAFFSLPTSEPILGISQLRKTVFDHHTNSMISKESYETNLGKNRTDESSSQTNLSLYKPLSVNDNKRMRTIPAGTIGSTHLIEPVHPGQPYINVVTVDRYTPRLPEHRSGIVIGPGEKLPGIPGYRIPTGFRGKIIFGDVAPEISRGRRKQDHLNVPLNVRQKNSFSTSFSDTSRRRFHHFRTRPRDSQSSQYNRNGDQLAIFCKYLSYSCKTMNDSNHKQELCNPFIIEASCCC